LEIIQYLFLGIDFPADLEDYRKLKSLRLLIESRFFESESPMLFGDCSPAFRSNLFNFCHSEARRICFIDCRFFVPQNDRIFKVAAKKVFPLQSGLSNKSLFQTNCLTFSNLTSTKINVICGRSLKQKPLSFR